VTRSTAQPNPNMNKHRLENYRILSELGRGGMSTVHKALQVSLERTVAIKEIHPNFSGSPELTARFEREARAIAQLSHPCIVQIYDYTHEGDAHFMVMEFIEGVDLKTAIERRGRLTPEQVLAIAVRVSAALAYAHSAGIIHRDIKPSNILLTREGQVKVVDFGIARMEEGEELTRTGAFVGTPAYMSPEQILGERLDGRTDLFSLGVVLYEALAGEKPFAESANASVSARILKSQPPRLRGRAPGVSRQLERIVMRCLEKKRDRRFGSMSELNLAVRAALPRGERQRPRALMALASQLQEAPAKGRRRGRVDETTLGIISFAGGRALGAAACLLLALGIGGGLWWMKHHRAPPSAAPAERRAAGVRPIDRPTHSSSAPASTAVQGRPAGPDADPAPPPAPPSDGTAAGTPPVAAAAPPRSAPGKPDTPGPGGAAGEAAPGLLKLVVKPWAEVRVDGRLHDTTPFDAPIPLTPGRHTIELMHETLPTRRLNVVAKSGETQRLDVDLRR